MRAEPLPDHAAQRQAAIGKALAGNRRQYVRGELNLRDAIFYAQRHTRQYAKRQLTWFRRETGLVWLKGFADTPGIREQALELVSEFV